MWSAPAERSGDGALDFFGVLRLANPKLSRAPLASALQNFSSLLGLNLSVRDGGTIDIRTIRVDRVSASVAEGGRIFARPQASMFATVMKGGIITYWGNAHVQSSIDGGGVVVKGDADEADKPLSELSSLHSSPPLLPPLPVIPPLPNPRK